MPADIGTPGSLAESHQAVGTCERYHLLCNGSKRAAARTNRMRLRQDAGGPHGSRSKLPQHRAQAHCRFVHPALQLCCTLARRTRGVTGTVRRLLTTAEFVCAPPACGMPLGGCMRDCPAVRSLSRQRSGLQNRRKHLKSARGCCSVPLECKLLGNTVMASSPPSSVAESSAPSQGAAKYEKVRDINSGSFGFVVQARHRDTGI